MFTFKSSLAHGTFLNYAKCHRTVAQYQAEIDNLEMKGIILKTNTYRARYSYLSFISFIFHRSRDRH